MSSMLWRRRARRCVALWASCLRCGSRWRRWAGRTSACMCLRRALLSGAGRSLRYRRQWVCVGCARSLRRACVPNRLRWWMALRRRTRWSFRWALGLRRHCQWRRRRVGLALRLHLKQRWALRGGRRSARLATAMAATVRSRRCTTRCHACVGCVRPLERMNKEVAARRETPTRTSVQPPPPLAPPPSPPLHPVAATAAATAVVPRRTHGALALLWQPHAPRWASCTRRWWAACGTAHCRTRRRARPLQAAAMPVRTAVRRAEGPGLTCQQQAPKRLPHCWAAVSPPPPR
mmetsp:Transcript_29459/g.96171  ORF Transcript_29459/g.96171 Transcript_29459/m.96171 type:complete len:290 (-) Transcript_29459:872-1741(-)